MIGLRADITAKDDAGCSLLHWAATYGHLHTLKMLQQKGLDIEGTANDRSTPLHSAAWGEHIRI